MKLLIPKMLVKIMSFAILTLTLSCSFLSCTKKVAFMNSAVVPAARGTIQVKRDKNMNYVIHVDVSELAEVSRLTPPKQCYVVWMESEQNAARNIGKISSSMGTLSKQLKASFETASATKPTRIFITAEDDPSVQYPNSQIILSTDTF